MFSDVPDTKGVSKGNLRNMLDNINPSLIKNMSNFIIIKIVNNY